MYAYAEVLRGRVLEAIGRALDALGPARLSWGRGQADFGANRRKSLNPNGPTDPDVPVLSVDAPDGRPVAVVFTYACHCTTVMATHFFKYSADFAGVAAEELERRRPGATALFVAGCGGDINPEPMGNDQAGARARPGPGRRGAAGAEAPGRAAALAGPAGRLVPRDRAASGQGPGAGTPGEAAGRQGPAAASPCPGHAQSRSRSPGYRPRCPTRSWSGGSGRT